MITFTDLFAGIGGFRYGLENIRPAKLLCTKRSEKYNSTKNELQQRKCLDFQCVWSNEWNKYARQIYKKHYGECDGRDIRTVPTKEIPDHDLLCAGFPCQSFSIAGKRGGFDDTRGTLFFEIAQVLTDKRPRYFLLENVKGLLSHEAGKTFQTILGVLTDLGYRCEWQVLNSKHFGVPQNRERVFIVGHLGEESGFQVFPIQEKYKISGSEDKRPPIRNKVASALTKDYRKAPLNRGETYIIHDKRQAKELRVQKEPCVTKHYGTGGGNVPMVANAVDCDGYLRQMGVHHDKPLCHYRIRRLTPIECERLQGFPDNWTDGISDTQRYKCLGNAVTTNVVEAIGNRLRKARREL